MTSDERHRRLRGIVLLILSASLFAGVDGVQKRGGVQMSRQRQLQKDRMDLRILI